MMSAVRIIEMMGSSALPLARLHFCPSCVQLSPSLVSSWNHASLDKRCAVCVDGTVPAKARATHAKMEYLIDTLFIEYMSVMDYYAQFSPSLFLARAKRYFIYTFKALPSLSSVRDCPMKIIIQMRRKSIRRWDRIGRVSIRRRGISQEREKEREFIAPASLATPQFRFGQLHSFLCACHKRCQSNAALGVCAFSMCYSLQSCCDVCDWKSIPADTLMKQMNIIRGITSSVCKRSHSADLFPLCYNIPSLSLSQLPSFDIQLCAFDTFGDTSTYSPIITYTKLK